MDVCAGAGHSTDKECLCHCWGLFCHWVLYCCWVLGATVPTVPAALLSGVADNAEHPTVPGVCVPGRERTFGNWCVGALAVRGHLGTTDTGWSVWVFGCHCCWGSVCASRGGPWGSMEPSWRCRVPWAARCWPCRICTAGLAVLGAGAGGRSGLLLPTPRVRGLSAGSAHPAPELGVAARPPSPTVGRCASRPRRRRCRGGCAQGVRRPYGHRHRRVCPPGWRRCGICGGAEAARCCAG